MFRGCHFQKDKENKHACLPGVWQLYFSADGLCCPTNLFENGLLVVDPLQMLHNDTAGGVVTAYRQYPINIPVMSTTVNDW